MLIRSPGYMAELDAYLKAERELARIKDELREKAEARQLLGKEAIDRETRIFLTHATISPYSGSKNPNIIKYFISEINRITERFNLNDAQLITLSGRNMTGRAEKWFHDYRHSTNGRDETFQQFTQALTHHFAGTHDIQEQVENIINLKQKNGVEEYSYYFRYFLQKLPEDFFTEELKVIFYIAGLKPNIKIEVQDENPPTLIEAIEISQAYENLIKFGSFGNYQAKESVDLDTKEYSDKIETTNYDEVKSNSVSNELQENMEYICFNCSKEGHIASQCPKRSMQ